jgi:segregation and condensation protein B
MTNEEIKKILEVLLFSSEEPLSIQDFGEIIEDADTKSIKTLLEELQKEYEESFRPMSIIEIAGGYQLTNDPYYAPWIRKLYKQERTSHLSMPALETLAIIAYKQPITRSEIEVIRGVNVDGVIHNLSERSLIRTVGRKDAPGRPILYATTSEFLKKFGLKSLEKLPTLKEFSEADIKLGEDKHITINTKGESDGTEQTAQGS